MFNFQYWKKFLLLKLLEIIFGCYGMFLMLKRIVLVGPRKYFTYKKRNTRPEILYETSYGKHTFVRLKTARVKLHCVVDGPKDGPVMLFLHGFPEFWYSWRHQIVQFRKMFRTMAIDMRGYGESDKPSGIENYQIDRLVNDINELLEIIGCTSCVLVAHDWGGAVAWHFAATYPNKVERLIIGNMPHPMAFKKHLKSYSQLLKSWYVFFFQWPMLPEYYLLMEDLEFLNMAFIKKGMGAKSGTFSEDDMECYRYTFADYSDISGPINYYRASFKYQTNTKIFEKKLRVPTLLIWGTEDGALESSLAQMSKSFVEDLNLKYIEGASHWVQQEYPTEFNAFMKKFLDV